MQPVADVAESEPDLAALRARDPDAWEHIYRSARPQLWRFARARLATDEQADDAVSETIVRAIAAVERYHPTTATLIPWLVGIARNVINEMYRAGSREARGTHAVATEPTEEQPDRLVAAEEAHAVRLAFAQLPADDQELLGLRVIARLDAETTATMLGKRPGAVRMAQSRALGRLRDRLGERLGRDDR
ncbi:MAG: sigma-70 family RNA polymerase sigma factor [Ilumatobacteraceae bacterium]